MSKKNSVQLVEAYDEDNPPSLITRKSCGCAVKACVLDEDTISEALDLFRRYSGERLISLEDLRETPLLEQFIEAARHDSTLELRPAEFVRKGGLTFHCKHVTNE